MKTVKIAKLKDELSLHLRAVQGGATFLVTDRDRPVAQISPVPAEDGFTLVTAKKPFSAVRGKRYPATRTPIDSLALLLAERGTR